MGSTDCIGFVSLKFSFSDWIANHPQSVPAIAGGNEAYTQIIIQRKWR